MTNLVAYEGCYWAESVDVFVGELPDPLYFDPVLLDLHSVLDPEYGNIDDVDFVRWDKDRIVVKADGVNWMT